MYAVVQTGGKQYKVSPGEQLHVELLDFSEAKDEIVSLGPVLLLKDDAGLQIGKPVLENVSIKAKLVGEERGPKVISFKYKRRKNYRKKIGHRQDYMLVEILPFETGQNQKPVKTAKETAVTEESEPKAVKSTTSVKKAPAKKEAAAKPASKKSSASKTTKE